MFDKILNLFFPNVCGFCGKICKEALCNKCAVKFSKTANIEICKNNLSYLAYMFLYNGQIRNKILNYKFHEESYLYKTFIKNILKNKKMCRFFKSYDIIMPVPIHKNRRKSRGYNQSELIAQNLAIALDITFEGNVLVKVKNNIAQSSLDRSNRKQNVIGAYEVKNNCKIQNAKIILIDDIYTTGSTANECAKVLKMAGAREVAIFVLAKD